MTNLYGSRDAFQQKIITANAKPPMHMLTPVQSPYIVENQWGSSDITQSVSAKVTLIANQINAGAEALFRRVSSRISPVLS